MAEITSLGLHTPSALHYLIAEGALPREPRRSLYNWKNYFSHEELIEEELLWTERHVVYSRNGYIQRVFDYREGNDTVSFAVLTDFARPADGTGTQNGDARAENSNNCQELGPFGRHRRRSRRSSAGVPGPTRSDDAGTSSITRQTDRALVILLGKQCHVHFLAGPSHIINVPFEVASVFSAGEGLILQRVTKPRPKSAGNVPAPPPNSFLSSQPQYSPYPRSPLGLPQPGPNFSLFDSPSKRHSISSALTGARFDMDDNDLPHFWSLTDPLSDFSAIASATVAPVPRHLRADDAGMLVEYDDIDASETLLYVSPHDELTAAPSAGNVALMFFITMNEDLDQITVWQGWYLKPRSLSALTAVRKAIQQMRRTRRSSVNNTDTTVSGTASAVRFHDRGRESFAANAELPRKSTATRRKKSQAAASQAAIEEADMALIMDPDFAAGSQPNASRKIASTLSRGDLATTDSTRLHTTGAPPHSRSARRGPSMRMSQDRRSLGTSMYRKSRGSVPGSTFSRSIGPEEDSMDMEDDTILEDELEAEVSRVTQLFLATHDFASVESTFAFGSEGVKPELVLRKVHVLPLSTQRQSAQKMSVEDRFKVCVLPRQASDASTYNSISIWVHDKVLQRTLKANFDVVIAPVMDDSQPTPKPTSSMAVSLFRSQDMQAAICDIVKVEDGMTKAIASSLRGAELEITTGDGLPWTIRLPHTCRLHDSADVRNELDSTPREVGLSRTVDLADTKLEYFESAKPGHFVTADHSGHFLELHLRLRPRNDIIDKILRVSKIVLSGKAKQSVTMLWASAVMYLKEQNLSANDAEALEVEALIVFLLSFAVSSLSRTRTSSRKSFVNVAPLSTGLLPQSEHESIKDTSALPAAWQCLAQKAPSVSSGIASPTLRHSNTANATVAAHALDNISMTDMEAKTRSLLHHLNSSGITWLMDPAETSDRVNTSLKLMLVVQLVREEVKLTSSEDPTTKRVSRILATCLAQLGHYLQQDSWDWRSGTQLSADFVFINRGFSDSEIVNVQKLINVRLPGPFSVNRWLESAFVHGEVEQLLDLDAIASLGSDRVLLPRHSKQQMSLLPRISVLIRFFRRCLAASNNSERVVEIMAQTGMTESFIATLPEATAGYIRNFISDCQSSPPSSWPPSLLRIINREDLLMVSSADDSVTQASHQKHVQSTATDLQTILASTERAIPTTRSHEADRHAIIAQIFSEDRRFVDAARLTNPSILQVAECPPQPGSSDEDHLEQQKKVMQWVVVRTVALPPGAAMIHFESQKPLISEKFQVLGFSTICQMKPMDNTVSADKTGLTEEKLSWAFFHAGVSGGLHISRKAAGIDTSWIVFNKPDELTNRHAGFLLALGLNGHLRNMAKWLAFKYLTPKHTMTSIGLLLGLSASYMGTMDSLITRMLSVHITRMLPPGAAELNVSPLTQTVGLLGVGLLYYNTQHRRMSEIMLSELEHRDIEEAGSAADNLRDESYRLAAGFSLGLMNLGKGNDLQGLQGMGLLERLLYIAVGPRPVELVHVVDKTTAGATLALAFIHMKTNDATIARKIDVPDALSQIDHIRPDILLLRTLAKNLIMWDSIASTPGWIRSQLPSYASHYFHPKTGALLPLLPLASSEIPLYNIITGHAWSLALRHAGTASLPVRDEILAYLDVFWSTSLQPAAYYDAQLARTTMRRCVDMLALAAATVMAGTGDVKTFRYLRRLHGRTDAETTYGSHMAAHLAVGCLFLGGGTYTFSTSDLAIAGLVMAFYPLWPQEVLDNAVHLQAFRHLWMLAAEARCVVCQDVDSGRPVQMEVKIRMRDGQEMVRKAPCLLPELDQVASVETVDKAWWRARLDFERNSAHVKSFKESQTLWVRRAPAKEQNPGLFGRTLKGLNEKETMPEWWRMWADLLKLPALQCLEECELNLAIPSNTMSGVHEDEKGTVLDDRLVLLSDSKSWDPQRLWNVRLLVGWAERKRLGGDAQLKWLGDEFVQRLEAIVQRRMAEVHGEPAAS